MTADDGLRKAIAREYAEFEAAPHEPESWQLDNGEDFAAAVLALPEVAALRAKAAAAEQQARERAAAELRAAASRVRRSCPVWPTGYDIAAEFDARADALTDARTDRGRC